MCDFSMISRSNVVSLKIRIFFPRAAGLNQATSFLSRMGEKPYVGQPRLLLEQRTSHCTPMMPVMTLV